MLKAVANETVSASADQVWGIIGGFHAIRKWASAVLDERCEMTPEGETRILKMPPDGREVHELLVARDTYSYSYQVLSAAVDAPRNFGTVSVIPLTAATSRIELESEFDLPAGVDEAEAMANKQRFLRGNLKAMKRALGLA